MKTLNISLPSRMYKLKLSDWLKGLLVAMGTVVFPAIISLLGSGNFPTVMQWKAIGIAAIAAGLTYVGKNFFTDENKVAVKTIQEAQKKQADDITLQN